MKITAVRTHPYQIKLNRAISDANDPVGYDQMPIMAVWIDTDVGVSGLTLSSPNVKNLIHNIVNGMLLDRDPRGVRGHWKRMMDAAFKGGNRGMVNGAISAIDIALWDLKAKLNNEPLWKTLGASTRKVRAYVSDIGIGLSDDALRQLYESMAAKGVNAGKIKVGLDQVADMRRIGIMRDALAKSGKVPILMVDSNEYWSPKQAIRHISEFERHYDIFWAEEPARRWDVAGLRKVSSGIRAAVSTGENLDDLSEFKPLISGGAADVIQIGSKTAGITGMLMVADLAYAFDLPISLMNCPAHFMAHVAAALPNHNMMECAMLGRGDGIIGTHSIEDGWITLGDRPGLGIEFDMARLNQLTAQVPGNNARAGSWGRRRGAALVEIPPNEVAERGEE